MNPTVITLGHSYIQRLSNFCRTNKMPVNFGISFINGIMYGKGGSKLTDIVNGRVFQKLIEDFTPEIVVL